VCNVEVCVTEVSDVTALLVCVNCCMHDAERWYICIYGACATMHMRDSACTDVNDLEMPMVHMRPCIPSLCVILLKHAYY
jgi:hypothetical protein